MFENLCVYDEHLASLLHIQADYLPFKVDPDMKTYVRDVRVHLQYNYLTWTFPSKIFI